MTPRRTLAALAAVLSTTACTPLSEPTAADFLAASPAAVSDYQRGKQDLGAGNYGLALAHFTAAVKRGPDTVAALNGQAITLAKLDRDDEAAAAFDRALEIDSASAVTLSNYAIFLDKHGNHAKAVALVAKSALRAAPQDAAPAKPAAAPPTVVATDPSPIRAALSTMPKADLTIANASGQYRLAHRLQQYLSGQGFAAERIANAARFDRTQSVLFCHADSRQAAEAIRRALPTSVKLVVLVSKANRIDLVAGSDLNNFDIKLAMENREPQR